MSERLEIELRKRRKRSEVLALPDADLLALDPSGAAARRYEAFDPDEMRARIAAAELEATCRCQGDDPVIARLDDLPDPPAVVFASDHGLLGRAAAGAVAVVGARHASPYGLEVAISLSRGLAEAGVPVISGMAIGVDSEAHRGALAGNGVTVAVLGGGADVPYPARAQALHARILEVGVVVSELPPGFRPRRWTFPARNRIIAALASVVVVVEGAERSGSLITADFAAELGRGVAAVPGPITARLSGGVNALLRAGAPPVRDVQDLLDELRDTGVDVPEPQPVHRRLPELDAPTAEILDAVAHGRGTLAALVGDRRDTAAVLQTLARLELLGLIRQEGHGRYVRAL